MITTFKADSVNFGAKGQVVIPRRLRREFEIEEGTRASAVSTPEGILLTPITRTYIKRLRGSVKVKGVFEARIGDRKRESDL